MNASSRGDFSEALEVVRDSRAWSLVEHASRVWRTSASDSRLVAAAKRVWTAVEGLPRAERFRAIALTAAVAAGGHALLVGIIPLPLRPAMPRTFWLVVSAASAAAAVRGGGRNQRSDA
jgi:hypothetical protein